MICAAYVVISISNCSNVAIIERFLYDNCLFQAPTFTNNNIVELVRDIKKIVMLRVEKLTNILTYSN